MSAPYERVASLLRNVKRKGSTLTACCPTHDDKNNSLSVTEGEDGRVLITCFAGCEVTAIVATIGLSMSDLFVEHPRRGVPTPQPCKRAPVAGVTLAQYAAAKKMPSDFLSSLGMSDFTYCGQPAIRIPYRDQRGSEVAVRFRTALEKSAEVDDRFRWRKGSKILLYGLWRMPSTNELVLCEGESDCQTLWLSGFAALGVPGAGNWNEERDAAVLDNVDKIFVVIEPDKGGEAVRTWLAKSRIAARANLIFLDGFKDVSALFLDDPAQFAARFETEKRRAVPMSSLLNEEDIRKKSTAWEKCKSLAQSENVLEAFNQALNTRGVVGEERTAKLLYLALTTRFFSRPVSVAIKGPSSGGKSFLTEQVLAFFPESAVYCLSAMSERVLAYTEADLRHRFLVVCEAAGITGDFASYLLRSLLSEGKLIYEVVEKTSDGMKPRRIEKSGPTGLLVTTTLIRLHPENETRLLSLGISDSQEQTQAVLIAIAKGADEVIDFSPWIALQEWLQYSEHRVIVPFARELAEKTKPVSVRLRRDFGAVLALVKAHAVLHQANRQRHENGAVIATLADYSAVRELAGTIVAEGIEATVSKNVRETVEAVRQILGNGAEEASLIELASVLKLDKSSASRRAADAIQRGHLKNLEEKRGRPRRLVLGDALPEEGDVLPSGELLQSCSPGPMVETRPPQSDGALVKTTAEAAFETLGEGTAEANATTNVACSIQTEGEFAEAEL